MKTIFKYPLEIIGILLVFSFLFFSIIYALGFQPVTKPVESNKNQVLREEVPIRVVAPNADVDINVRNPDSTDINVLDTELKYGAVRYPGSGLPGNGNMFIFAHSADAWIVQNPALRAFDGLSKLKKGDDIFIYSNSQKHTYKVLNVELVSANEALVDFSGDKEMLTLSTCNTFGAGHERFVVEADYIGSEEI